MWGPERGATEPSLDEEDVLSADSSEVEFPCACVNSMDPYSSQLVMHWER